MVWAVLHGVKNVCNVRIAKNMKMRQIVQIVRKWLNEKLWRRKKSDGDTLEEGTKKADWGRVFVRAAKVVVQLNNNFLSITYSRLTQYRNLRGHYACVCAILLIILWMSNSDQHTNSHTNTLTHQNFVHIYISVKILTHRTQQPVKARYSLASTSAVWVKPDRMSFTYFNIYFESFMRK